MTDCKGRPARQKGSREGKRRARGRRWTWGAGGCPPCVGSPGKEADRALLRWVLRWEPLGEGGPGDLGAFVGLAEESRPGGSSPDVQDEQRGHNGVDPVAEGLHPLLAERLVQVEGEDLQAASRGLPGACGRGGQALRASGQLGGPAGTPPAWPVLCAPHSSPAWHLPTSLALHQPAALLT